MGFSFAGKEYWEVESGIDSGRIIRVGMLGDCLEMFGSCWINLKTSDWRSTYRLNQNRNTFSRYHYDRWAGSQLLPLQSRGPLLCPLSLRLFYFPPKFILSDSPDFRRRTTSKSNLRSATAVPKSWCFKTSSQQRSHQPYVMKIFTAKQILCKIFMEFSALPWPGSLGPSVGS